MGRPEHVRDADIETEKYAYPAFNSDFVDHRWLSLIHYVYINIYMAFGAGSVGKTIHESFFTVSAS